MTLAPIRSEVLAELAEFVHLVTRLKLVPDAAQDAALTPEERTRGQQFSQLLVDAGSDPRLAIAAERPGEVKDSPRPLAAADMVLVRLALCRRFAGPGRGFAQIRRNDRRRGARSQSRSRDAGAGARAPSSRLRAPQSRLHARRARQRAEPIVGARPVRGCGGTCRPPSRHSIEARA